MTSLRNQTILIIGGTSGIGFSVAEASLHQHAAHVIVASSTPEKVSKTVARLEETTTKNNLSGKVTGKTLDVSNSDQVKKFFAEIGELDHVVITSGDKLKLGFKGVDLETLKSALDVRFWAAALIAQQARIKKGGSITLTGGVFFSIFIPTHCTNYFFSRSRIDQASTRLAYRSRLSRSRGESRERIGC